MKKIWIMIAIITLVGGMYYLYKNSEQNKNYTNNVQKNENIATNEKSTIYNENNVINSNQYDNNINNINSQNNIEEKNDTNISNNGINEEFEQKQTNLIKEENTVSNNMPEKNTNKDITTSDIKEKLAPSGFMGSSLLRVAIYSNNEVYLLKYDGEGYEDKNIVDKELIATNASSIYSKGKGEDFEAIVVKGKSNMQINSKNYAWIEFEK